MSVPCRKWGATLLVSALFLACGNHPDQELPGAASNPRPGTEGVLIFRINDSTTVQIPGERFAEALILHNGPETLSLRQQDSTCYEVPVFSGLLCLNEFGEGSWTDVLRVGDNPYSVPCTWQVQAHTPVQSQKPDSSVWRLYFGEERPWPGDLYLWRNADGMAEATIETATGDFRFLHGRVQDDQFVLQTFDGAHLFHFAGKIQGDSIVQGWFASGNHFGTPFRGSTLKNDALPLSNGQTAQWTGRAVQFQGKTLLGEPTEWSWEANPKDSVHVLSIMGSWCPNCLDEHRLLLDLMDDFPLLRVHTLAFERGLDRANGEKIALRRLAEYSEQLELWRHRDRWDITLVGPASKTEAQEKLPFVDRVVSFPTTVVLHPESDEPWIHSGFNGPATGVKYDLEKRSLSTAISGSSENH